jgi:hypothetical protein
MNGWLAIVAYQGRVAGVPDGSIDVQVRYFKANSSADVKVQLRREPVHAYVNDQQQDVSWPLVEIFAIQPMTEFESGDELVGFIAGAAELEELCRIEAPADFSARSASEG